MKFNRGIFVIISGILSAGLASVIRLIGEADGAEETAKALGYKITDMKITTKGVEVHAEKEKD